MVTSNVLAACILMVCFHHYFGFPTKPEYDNQIDSEISDLDTIRDLMKSQKKLGHEIRDKMTSLKTKFHRDNPEVNGDFEDNLDEGSNIDHLKKHWLSLLGLQNEPTKSLNPARVPTFMRAMYALYDSEFATDAMSDNSRPRGSDEENDRTIRALVPEQYLSGQRNWTFNNVRPDEVLDRYSHAELVLHMGKKLSDDLCDALQGSSLMLSTSVSDWTEVHGVRRKIDGIPECWEAFDLSRIFDVWRIETESVQSGSMYVAVRLPENASNIFDLYGFDAVHEPLLVLYTHDPSEIEMIQTLSNTKVNPSEFIYDTEDGDDSSGSRVKRSMADERYNAAGSAGSSEDEDAACSLKRWYVTFEKLGWGDWIVTPRGINANFCTGSCSVVRNMTNHAFIKKVFRDRYDRYDLPPACCVPTRIQPMSVLFSTNGTIFLKQMPEMKAEACGCL